MSEQNTEFKHSSLSLMLQCKNNSMWRKNTRAEEKNGLGKAMRAPRTRKKTFSHSRSRILMAFVLKHLQDLEHRSTYWCGQAFGQTIYSIKLVKKPWVSFCLNTASQAIINPKENNAFCWQNIIFHISLRWRDKKEREKLQLCFFVEQGKQFWGWIPLTQAKWL